MTTIRIDDYLSRKQSDLERTLYDKIVSAGLPQPVCVFTGNGKQWRFHPVRRWRFDFAWPDKEMMIAMECQGGLWRGKGHGTGAKYRADREKAAYAQFMGWVYLEASVDMIRDGMAVELLRQAFLVRTGVDFVKS